MEKLPIFKSNELCLKPLYYSIIIAWRNSSEFTSSLLFFLMLISLFCLSAQENLMPQLSLLWIAVIFANLLGLRDLFAIDKEDGSLDIVLLQPKEALLFYIYSKLLRQILTNIFPIILIYPLAGMMLHLKLRITIISAVTCFISSLAISFLGSLSAAINLMAKPSAFLNFIIILPFTVPIFIFALGADIAILQQNNPAIPILFLIALAFLFAIIGPIGASLILRYLHE